MPSRLHQSLSRRERQIMDLLYSRGRMTAEEVREGLPDPPTNSAVRAMLGTLERKGHIRHERDSLRYVYRPVVSRKKATRSAVRYLMDTFFDGSVERAVAAVLDSGARKPGEGEVARLRELIENARKEGR